MGILKRDNNEGRFNSLMLLPKTGNPSYYEMLFKNAKAFFYGMRRPDLVDDLEFLLHHRVEIVMGTDIQTILITFKNLPALNDFTRSRNPLYKYRNIYKMQIQSWLDEIEKWVFKQAIELEREIRFTSPLKQWI